jgi:hypothetical protein
MIATPRAVTSFLYLFAQRMGPPLVRLLTVYADDDLTLAEAALQSLRGIGLLRGQQVRRVAYPTIVAPANNRHIGGQTRPLISNGFATQLTPALTDMLAEGLRRHISPWITLRAVGGAVQDVDATATAFAHRHQQFNVSGLGLGTAASVFYGYWDELRPHLDGLYLSFETDTRAVRLHDAFPPDTLQRLQTIKARYDPDNLFRDNFNVFHAAPPEVADVEAA